MVLFAHTWKHGQVGHRADIGFTFEVACKTMTDPDCIIQSKPGPLAKTRTGSMLYARKLEPGPGYVMVPAKTTDKVEEVNGVEYAPGSAVLGLSIIPTEELPQRRRLYTRPTKKPKS